MSQNISRLVVAQTARKVLESSKRPSKYYLFINLLAYKRPYFPSPESSKQELFNNQ